MYTEKQALLLSFSLKKIQVWTVGLLVAPDHSTICVPSNNNKDMQEVKSQTDGCHRLE